MLAVDIFLTVIQFLFLCILAAGAVGGLIFGKKILDTITNRAAVESIKAKRERSQLEHEYAIQLYQQDLRVLALTEGDKGKDKDEMEDDAEEAEGEVIGQVMTHEEYMKGVHHRRMAERAADAEVADLEDD